jgi:hypothetical protein
MLVPVVEVRWWPMAEIKQERVAGIANSITLEAIPLLLVDYSKLHSRLETGPGTQLFVCQWPQKSPAPTCQFVQKALGLPQRIQLLLLLWTFTVVLQCEKPAEVPPTPDGLYRHSSCQVLLIKCFADQVASKQWLLILQL